MDSNYCKYLWVSKGVSILAYACGTYFILMITFIWIDLDLAQNIILIYIFIAAVLVFVVIELYAHDIFKKLELQEDYYLNKSLILYREHKKVCKD